MGVFQSITTHYAVEITPTSLRGYVTTYVNLCWVRLSDVFPITPVTTLTLELLGDGPVDILWSDAWLCRPCGPVGFQNPVCHTVSKHRVSVRRVYSVLPLCRFMNSVWCS